MNQSAYETGGTGPSHRSVEVGVAGVMAVLALVGIYGSIKVGIGWADDGPRAGFFPFYVSLIVMICGSGALVAIAWVINSMANSLFLLYVGAAVGGIGAGVIYGGSVGNALKWFPDRRGLAAGLTAAGFGAGSALTVIPIANMIASSGYQSAFLWFGLGQGIIVMIVALLLRAPETGEVAAPAAPAVQQTRRDYGPAEALKTPVFWVMYVMFVAGRRRRADGDRAARAHRQ